MPQNKGASASSSGSYPSGHARCAVDGASRFDPSRKPRVWNARKKNAPLTVVYVGRGTPWGNPFVMGRDGDRDTVCDRFEREVLPSLDVSKLVGQDLLCWCAPLRCHADALLRKANAIAIEARRAIDAGGGVVACDESAGPKDIAQNTSREGS